MSKLVEFVGKRIRNYRLQMGLSQEKLAELSECRPTYIGQIERGEKNATPESIEKISVALGIPLSRLFEKPDETGNPSDNIPLCCYEYILTKSKAEPAQIYRLLSELDKYKSCQ